MVESTGGFSSQSQGSVLVTPSGKIVGSAGVTAKERSKGRRGTSRSSARRAEIARKKEAQRLEGIRLEKVRLEKIRTDELKRITEIARVKELRLLSNRETFRIQQLRNRIRQQGGSSTVRFLTDSNTGDKLRVTTTSRGNNRSRIFEVQNLTTGASSVRTFERPASGGRVVETGGLIRHGTKLSSKQRLSSKDTSNKFVGEVQAIRKEKGIKGLIQKINSLQKIRSTASIRNKQSIIKNELQLLGLTVGTVLIGGVLGFIALPSVIKSIVKNPLVLTKIPSAISNEGKVLGQLIRVSPTEAIARIGSEYLLLAGSGKVLKVSGSLSKTTMTKLGIFKGVKKNVLGVRYIKGIKKVGNIEIIPSRKDRLVPNIKKAIKTAKIEEQLTKTPKLPKVNNVQKNILNVVKKRGDIVTGSFAQRVLLRKKFTRKFDDLDIVSKNPEILIKELKKVFGNRASFKKLKVSTQLSIDGKAVADIVKFSVGEGGFIKKFKVSTIGGIKLANPKSRLGGKLTALKQGNLKAKTLKDIKKISGGRLETDIPAVKGAFGKTKRELREQIGKRGPVITSQVDIFKGLKSPSKKIVTTIKNGKVNLNKLKVELKDRFPDLKLTKFLYASPFRKGKVGQARISRLGLESEEAKFLDYLLGEEIAIGKAKPEILVFPNERIFPKGLVKTKEGFVKTKGFEVPEFSSELEVVLGKGWGVRKGKVLRRVNIDGTIVPVREVKKIKLSKGLVNEHNNIFRSRKELNKIINSKSLSNKDIPLIKNKVANILKKESKVNKLLRKETGFNPKVSSSLKKGGKTIPLKRIISSGVLTKLKRVSSKIPSRKKPTKKTPSRKTPSRKTPSKKTPSRKTPSRKTPSKKTPSRKTPSRKTPSKATPSRPTPRRRTPPKAPPRKTPPIIRKPKKSKAKKKKKKKAKAYNVLARPLKRRRSKTKPKLLKVNTRPLTKRTARDLRNYVTDTSLGRTARIKPTKGKPQRPLIKVPVGYAKKTSKKFRRHTTRKGKRIKLPKGKVIERSKRLLDTRGEKRGISVKRRIAQLRKTKKVKKKRRVKSASQTKRKKPLKRKKK